ncbi:MAG: hypothetical protein HQM10_07180 [Candidatus Riflebacteria bacterium]|nr:hypothetical protein [Candidatus Riflebacteria bacterium]
MKIFIRTVYVFLLVSFVFQLNGCKDEKRSPALPKVNKLLIATSPADLNLSVKGAIVKNALEQAHQDYLDSYEKYVQMLRKKGPQTIETLDALADYQKKYRLYQNMLSSEKD